MEETKPLLISLREFQHLASLRSDELIHLLEQGLLQTSQGTTGELLIDLSSLETNTVLGSFSLNREPFSKQEILLLEESIASKVLESMDGIVDEAMELVEKWLNKQNSSQEPPS